MGTSGSGLEKVEIAGRWFGRRPDGSWVVWNDDVADWERAPAPPDALLPPRFGTQPGPALRASLHLGRNHAQAFSSSGRLRPSAVTALGPFIVVMMLAAPLMSLLVMLVKYDELSWPMWFAVSSATEIILAGMFLAHRAEKAKARETGATPEPVAIMAAPERRSSGRRVAITFLIIFTFVFAATFSLGVTVTSLAIDLGVAALFTAIWEFRGTYGGLVLAAATIGWVVAASLYAMWAFLSLMTWSLDAEGPNFAAWWAGSAAVVLLVLLPFKKRLAEFQLSRPQRFLWGSVAAAMLAVMVLANATVRFSQATEPQPALAPVPVLTPPVSGRAAFPLPSTPEQAADSFVRAWARSGWSEVARISSPQVADQAEAMGPQDGDYLGCGDLNAQVHCVVKVDDGFALVLPSGDGSGGFYVTSLQILDRATFNDLVAAGLTLPRS